MWITGGQKNSRVGLSGLRWANKVEKMDQDAISICTHNGPSVTLFPILESGPISWICGVLVPILPTRVSHPLKCNKNSCCRPTVDKQN